MIIKALMIVACIVLIGYVMGIYALFKTIKGGIK